MIFWAALGFAIGLIAGAFLATAYFFSMDDAL